MNTFLLLYLIQQTDSIRNFLDGALGFGLFGAAILLIVNGVRYIIWQDTYGNDVDRPNFKPLNKWATRLVIASVVCGILGAIIPSSKTLAIALAGSEVVRLAHSDATAKIGDNSVKLINKFMENELQTLDNATKKEIDKHVD